MSSSVSLNIDQKESEEPDVAPISGTHSFLGLRGHQLNFAVSCFAGVGFLLFGYDQGVMGSLLTLPAFENTFPGMKASTNATLQGAVIALYEIGCMMASLSTIYLGDKLGRLKIMFIGSVIVCIGGALQACAYTIAHLTVARIFTGLGTGFITSTVPVYQSECSPAKKRGQLIMMEGSLIALGIAISYWIDFGFYFVRNDPNHGDAAWRVPIALQCLFPILLISTVFYFPESPRWLMNKGRVEDAKKVFSALYDLPVDSRKIQVQINEIQAAIALEKDAAGHGFSIKDLFTQGPARNFHRVSLACWSQIMQQITGINLITYYAGTIFESYIGMSPLNSRILAAANGTEYFLASLIGFYTIERLGRRFLLFWGAISQAICMAILTGTTYAAGKGNSGAGIAAAVFLFAFNSCFGVSYLGGTWLLPPELLSLKLRAPGAALSTACNWVFNFMVVMITPVAFESIGCYTYTIFAAINLLMAPVVFFFYPETKGRSLEEMDIIFNHTPVWQPWKVVQVAKDLPIMHEQQLDKEGDLYDGEKGDTEHIEVLKEN
ncbi:putative sugar transporter [Scheffersomyces xylosifermentans]|uniref:putative sugar transporter n=1 Tax=Scheffersomyces xylosifermentans TaxID=1304137 RepID=UPI00315C6730